MFKVEACNEGETRALAVEGEVDMHSSPQLMEAIRGALSEGKTVAVDLSAVTYIDSAGIAVLIQGLKAAKRSGLGYRLRSPSARVMSVIALSQLEDFFEYEGRGESS